MFFIKTKNKLYRTKRFWLTKKWLGDKPVFSFWKGLYRGSYTANRFTIYKDILLPTLTSFAWATIYSAFIVFVLELFNVYYPVSIQFDKQAIDTFLSVIASVSGVFLGLYFTAISSIASNYLLRAPQNVKRFFLSEPRGQQYIRTIAITAIVSVFYIVTKSFGHTIHPAGIVFLSLLVAYIVIRFWHVGSSVFYSLEPEFALPWITRDILFSMKKIVPPGFQWNKPALQNHHRTLVTAKFDVIKNLVRFGKEDIRLSDEQIEITMRYIGGLLFSYATFKNKTPTDSYWFETKNQFQDWTLADSSQIAIALNTGTPLRPQNIKNYTWFEEELLNIAVQVFQSFSDSKKFISSAQSMDVLVEVAEIYAADFDVKSAKLLFEKLKPIKDLVYTIQAGNAQHLLKAQLAFVDAQGRLATSALLGLTKYFREHTCEDIINRIMGIKWSAKKEIYLTGLPTTMLPRLESLYGDLRNEKSIEGKRVTADWYIKTYCLQQYVYSLKAYFDFLKSLHSEHFQIHFDALVSGQQPQLAVHLIQKWKEFASKYRNMVYELRKHIECITPHRLLSDLPWVDFNFDEEIKVAETREKEVTDKMVQLLPLPQLQTLNAGDDLPDYFGQALTEGVQACYDACEDKDQERLKRIFPFVFTATLAAHDRLREKVKDWTQIDSQLIFSTEPLENLFEISGYAKLYSELYAEPALWSVVELAWNTYFKAVDAKKVIEFIAAISSYRDSLFTIMPQATLRSNWQIDFENKLRERGIPVFPDDRSYRRRQPTHQSPIIRVLERSGGLRLMASARDIFFVTYLSTLPAAEGVELPDRHNFKESIQEEQRNPNQEINEDE